MNMPKFIMETNFGFLLITLIGCVGAVGISCKPKRIEITPQKALVIFTQESWGCIQKQIIDTDVTKSLTQKEKESVTIKEIKNPEDVNNRHELFLCFDGKQVNKLEGYYVLGLNIYHPQPSKNGYFTINQAKMIKQDKNWVISLKIKGIGTLKPELFYSRSPGINPIFHSCPEADIKAFKTTLLKAYKIPKGLEEHTLSEEWAVINIPINDYFLEQGRLIDRCEEVLDALEKIHSSKSEYLFLWERDKISEKRIKDMVKKIENERKDFKFNITIKFADERIIIGESGLVPVLQQSLTIKTSKTELVSGSIWITPTLIPSQE